MPHLFIVLDRFPAVRPRLAAAGLLAAAAALSGCSDIGALRAARVATGFASHHICSDVYISGMTPEDARAQRISPQPGVRWLDPWMHIDVDAAQQEVRASLAGGLAQRAGFTPGLGCRLLDEGDAVPVAATLPPAGPAVMPDIAGTAPVPAATPALQAALALAFDDSDGPHAHQTKAVVVLRDGRVIAERYAPGTGPETPWLGFSMSKSLTQALLGVLVQQGRLSATQPAALPGWAGDARREITVEHLLRQTSGLALWQDNSGFDVNSRMLYIERDMAAFAARQPAAAPPGQGWHYADGHFILLSSVLRNAVSPADASGAAKADAVRAFAQRELFGPLGMRHMTMEFDGAGTPMGASFSFGSARDWARLGQLYLDDGVVGGRRLLPEGWVAMARTPTLATGYGAGWWTNALGDRLVPEWQVPYGFANAPKDAFFARGFMGQFTLVIPSERLVIVRMGISHWRGDDIVHVDRMVGAVRAALGLGQGAATRAAASAAASVTTRAAATARAPG